LPVLWVGVVGEQDNHSILLVYSAQPVQVGVLFEPVRGVAIGWQFIVTIKYGNGIFIHTGYKALTVLDKNGRIERQIFHVVMLKIEIE
jgi:hypothetical protein